MMLPTIIIILALCFPIIAAYLVYKAGPYEEHDAIVSNIDTSPFSAGDKLYLDPDKPGCLITKK